MNNEGIEPNNENKFNPKKIYESFYDILKYSNYKVLKCIHLVFKKQTFISNKGSIIVIIYFSIYLIILIIFIFKGITSLKLICSQFEGYPQINPKEIKSNDNTIKTIKLKTINKKK